MAIDRILRGGWNGWSDRHTRRFAPLIGHWTADGCRQSGRRCRGSASPRRARGGSGGRARQSRRASAPQRNWIAASPIRGSRCGITSSGGTGRRCPRCPTVDNWYAARFDAAYRDAQGDNCSRNDLFVTFVMHRAAGFRGRGRGRHERHPGHRRYHDRGIRGQCCRGSKRVWRGMARAASACASGTAWCFRRSPRRST